MNLPNLDEQATRILRDLLSTKSVSFGAIRERMPPDLRGKAADLVSMLASFGIIFVSGKLNDSFEASFTQISLNPAMTSIAERAVQEGLAKIGTGFTASSSNAVTNSDIWRK
jgi:hypothetical protein